MTASCVAAGAGPGGWRGRSAWPWPWSWRWPWAGVAGGRPPSRERHRPGDHRNDPLPRTGVRPHPPGRVAGPPEAHPGLPPGPAGVAGAGPHPPRPPGQDGDHDPHRRRRPPEYPGGLGTRKDRQLLGPTQGTDGLTGLGRRSSGRRPDGRPFAAGTQHGRVTYLLAWPYHCPGQAPCPPAARWRVLQLEAVGQGAGWPEVQRVVRHLVETIGPITNALPGGPFQPEEPGLFGEPLTTLASGGQGDYVWEASGGRRSAPPGGYWVEIHFPKFKGMGSSLVNVPGDLTATMMCVPHRAGVIYGAGPQTVVTVRVELTGRPAVTAPHRRARQEPSLHRLGARPPTPRRPGARRHRPGCRRATGRSTGKA